MLSSVVAEDLDQLEKQDNREQPQSFYQPWADVPWRTILATIGLVAAALLLTAVIYLASRVVIWVAVAGFFAIVLARPVAWVQTHLRLRRGAAVGLVVLLTFAAVAAMVAVFFVSVREQLVAVLSDLPGTLQQASEGRGPVGSLVTRLHLEQLVRRNQDTLSRATASIEGSLPALISSAIEVALAMVTVVVTACLMLTQSGALSRAAVGMIPVRHRAWITQVAREAASAVSGYMIGNIVLSLCAGTAAFAILRILRVPSPAVLALWFGFADLIPLVGATLGAIVVVLAAFFVSPTAGVIALIFFVLYQQFENGVLQIVVMARAVHVNSLMVLFSMLIGIELFGFVGALLSVPIAGAISVVTKALWRHRPQSGRELAVEINTDVPK